METDVLYILVNTLNNQIYRRKFKGRQKNFKCFMSYKGFKCFPSFKAQIIFLSCYKLHRLYCYKPLQPLQPHFLRMSNANKVFP